MKTISHLPLTHPRYPHLALDTALHSYMESDVLQIEADFPIQQDLSLLQKSLTTHFPNQPFNLTQQIRSHRTQLAGQSLRNVKNTIAIASGKGGVGKSTVSVNLAVALAKAGATVGLLDADIYGPSVPLMMGVDQKPEVINERYEPVLAHGVQVMSIGLLADLNQALMWRGPMLAKALIQMLDITAWHDLDYLFIDLPPGTGDIQLSLVQKIPLTGAIVVTTPQPVATLDAQKAVQLFQHNGIDVLGLIENMSTHACTHCGHEEKPFGEGGGKALSKQFDLPLIGDLPLDLQVRSQGDTGQPTALDGHTPLGKRWMELALQTALYLAQKPLNYESKFPEVRVE